MEDHIFPKIVFLNKIFFGIFVINPIVYLPNKTVICTETAILLFTKDGWDPIKQKNNNNNKEKKKAKYYWP